MKSSHTLPSTILPIIWEKNYNISRLLSVYTHNIIYELTEVNSGKKYILKILDKKYFHKRLYQTLSLSDCHSLLLPIDFTKDSQFVYFIYDYCPCLTDLLSVREFSYSELFTFLQDIGNAILFLHKNHITHCDIAPGNIFMMENGHFILGDFSSSHFEKSDGYLLDSILYFMKNFGCRRTGNTPFFSPPDYSDRQNGYYIDCYGFAMLLFLLLNKLTPPSEKDFAELDSFPKIKQLLLSTLIAANTKELPDFQDFFYQLEDIFQNTDKDNPIFHTTIMKQENTDFFLRTASLNSRQHPRKKQNNTGNKPKLAILLYGFLFLSVLIFSISFYHSLIIKKQNQTNITRSVLSEQDKKIFMNKKNLTSLNFLQENHSVQILVLSENNITSVKPLADLSQLIILDLSCNQQLTDILSLTNLQQLQQLILTDTNITKEELTILKNALTNCTILY